MRRLFTATDEEPAQKETGHKHTLRKRFIIRFGEHLKTLAVEDIAYCCPENKVTYARKKDGRDFPMDYNLDDLEEMLDPQQFSRLNRQYIVNLQAIEKRRTYIKSRIVTKFKPVWKEHPVISSERSADFKLWPGGEL